MSDEDIQIVKKSTRLSMKKGPRPAKVVPVVVEPVVVEPVVVAPTVVEPVKKEKKPRVKKVKAVPVLSDSSDDGAKPASIECEPKTVRKVNNWISHCKEYRASHPDIPYKQCLSEAKLTYKKA